MDTDSRIAERTARVGTFRALDWVFDLAADPTIVEYLADRFQLLAAAEATPASTLTVEIGGAHEWSLRCDHDAIATGAPGDVLAQLIAVINREAVRASPGLPLHAGAVLVDGEAVIICGKSHTGKSTLTAAAVAAGCTYLADEIALVRRSADPGVVHVVPYRRPIGLRRGGAAAIGIPIPESPGHWFEEIYPWLPQRVQPLPREPIAVGALLVLTDNGDHNVAVGEHVPPAQALLLLAEHAVDAVDAREAFRIAEQLVRTTPVMAAPAGDAIGNLATISASQARDAGSIPVA